MYATEFQTIINEPYIHIPNFESFKGHKVRVVLLDMDKETAPQNNIDIDMGFIDNLIKNPRHIEKNINFFSRDEVNER